jgi:Cu2+-exporting ATPase
MRSRASRATVANSDAPASAGSLRVEVTGTGQRTALANIMRLVEQVANIPPPQALADRAAFILTIVAIFLGRDCSWSSTVQLPAASRMS